jgi:hypothetical protein
VALRIDADQERRERSQGVLPKFVGVVSRAAEFHHRALAEPDGRLPPHPAPIVRPRP